MSTQKDIFEASRRDFNYLCDLICVKTVMSDVILSMGSNIGNREMLIAGAVKLISERCGVVAMKSSLYETEPWGFDSNGMFLNQIIKINTELDPTSLLENILQIEIELGRNRTKPRTGYESRPIDIDIIYFSDLIINTPDLTVPHPRMQMRRFVLVPLTEILPDFVHPLFKKNSSELLKSCSDTSMIEKYPNS